MLKRVTLPLASLGLAAALMLSGAALAQDAGTDPEGPPDEGIFVIDPLPWDEGGEDWVGIDPIEWECGDACIILIGDPGEGGEGGEEGTGEDPASGGCGDGCDILIEDPAGGGEEWFEDCQSEICYSGAPTSGEEVLRPSKRERAAKALKTRLGKVRGGPAKR